MSAPAVDGPVVPSPPIRVYVNGTARSFDPLWWAQLEGAQYVRPDARTNGMGPEFSFWIWLLVPKKVFGIELYAPSVIHDEMSCLDGTNAGFIAASSAFGRNVERWMRFNHAPVWLARIVGRECRLAVHVLGPWAFRWSDGSRPSSFPRRLVEAWNMRQCG